MTNEKALTLNNVLTRIEAEYFNSNSKFDIPRKLLYVAVRNISKLKRVVKEKEELEALLLKDFKKEYSFDDEKATDEEYTKEADKHYRAYRETDEIREQLEFYTNDFEGELMKISSEVLEEAILPSQFLDILEEIIVE